ncbi:hypothetical protein FC695_20995, partial [Bacillus cereus]
MFKYRSFQPFWALPALAIAGLGARDIMG